MKTFIYYINMKYINEIYNHNHTYLNKFIFNNGCK